MSNVSFVYKALLGALILGGGLLLLSSAARMTGVFPQDTSPFVYIYNCVELQGIGDNPSANYALANDIDCYSDSSIFNVIPTFSGTFNGRGKTISNVKIDVRDEPAGIFATLENASILNLNLENIVVLNTTTQERANLQPDTGALAGRALGVLKIENISARNLDVKHQTGLYDYGTTGGLIGRVTGNKDIPSTIENILLHQGRVEGRSRVGGLIGSAAYVNLSNISTIIDVRSWYDPRDQNIGGLIGEARFLHLSDSYAGAVLTPDYGTQVGNVTSEGDNVGGLVGYLSDSKVARSYALGKISGKNHVGGLIGFNANCSASAVTDSYWGIDSTAIQPGRLVEARDEHNNCIVQEDVFNGVGLNNDKLKDRATFENWDFDQTWANEPYPYATFQFVHVPSPNLHNGIVVKIKDCQSLQDIPAGTTLYYQLTNDINCYGVQFTPIKDFKGIFDGAGMTISNVTVSHTNGPAGIFAVIQDGEVFNLKLNNINVTNTSTSDQTGGINHNTGALAGSVFGKSQISYVKVSNVVVAYTAPGPNPYTGATGGVVGRFDTSYAVGESLPVNLFDVHITEGKVSGTSYVGGLVGYAAGKNPEADDKGVIVIERVSSLVDVTGNSYYIGGLVGSASLMHLRDSYSTARIVITASNEYITEMGNVIPQPGTGEGVGGLVGNLYASTVERTYSMGKVDGIYWVGALIGKNECSNYPVIGSYWNEDSTGIKYYRETLAKNERGVCALRKDTFNGEHVQDSMLRDENTYKNWNFESIWMIYPYPMLKNFTAGAR